ncbi:MAG: ABC transporter substrate-binding protein [Lachnospiraceae bacterium]
MNTKGLLKKGIMVAVLGSTVASLAACGGNGKEEKDLKIGSDIIKDEVTLQVSASQGKIQNYMTEVVKIYNEKNDANVKLEFITVASGTATVQMITPKLVSKEEMPDIVSISDDKAAGIIEKFEDSFYSATAYGFYDKYGSDFYNQKLNILKAQSSKNEVIPFANDFTAAFSYYQPEAFEAVGKNFEDIKSWDEYIEVAKEIKEKTGLYGIALPEAGESELFVDLMAQQGVSLVDKDGNINLGTKEAQNAAEIIKKMVDAGIVNFYGSQDGEKAFQECAMFVAGGWYAKNMELNFPDAEGKWRMSSLVPFSEQNPGKSPVSGGSSWYVPKEGKNPEVALQFLTFISTDEDCMKAALEGGVAVSNAKAYETDSAKVEFPYYGNQKYYDVINATSSNIAEVFYTPSYSDATSYVATASYEYWNSGDYEKSFIKEANNFAQKYSVEVNK